MPMKYEGVTSGPFYTLGRDVQLDAPGFDQLITVATVKTRRGIIADKEARLIAKTFAAAPTLRRLLSAALAVLETHDQDARSEGTEDIEDLPAAIREALGWLS
jgi:hypothetical protein